MTHRITFLRNRLGLSQAALGERVGLPQSAIANVESGKRSLKAHEMKPFAKALEVHVLDLLQLSVMADIGNDVANESPQVEPSIETAMASKGLMTFRVIRNTVAAAGVKTGSIVIGDSSKEALDDVKDGDILVADVHVPTENVNGRVLRQHLNGGLLTTNRVGRNVSFNVNDPDFEVTLVAVIHKSSAIN